MIELKGRADRDFDQWLYNSYREYWRLAYSTLPESAQLAMMVEWLDTVYLHIAIEPHIGGGADVYYAKVVYRMDNFIDTWCDVENTNLAPNEYYFSSRADALKVSVYKAMKMYNEDNK